MTLPRPGRRRFDVEFPGRETRNRGYSYPSWGRVRALQAIPRPRISPDRPQNAQNGRECNFPGFGGHGAWMPATSRPKTHPRADPQARAGQGQAPGGPSRITSAGSSARTGLRSAVDPATGFERWSTSPAAAPVAGRKRRGQRGQSPPPASAGDARSVAPRSTLLTALKSVQPALGGAAETASQSTVRSSVYRTVAGKLPRPLGRQPQGR